MISCTLITLKSWKWPGDEASYALLHNNFIGDEEKVASVCDDEVHQLYRVVNKFALVSVEVL